MILIIDNYDSFVHNLARYFQLCGQETTIFRNDEITLQQIKQKAPKAIILSPGPCTPKEAGICTTLIRELYRNTPILGVCLGHQAIAEAFGGQTIHAQSPTHGQASLITHENTPLFKNIENPMACGRYHSLAATLPDISPLRITARTQDGTIMALEHTSAPLYGVQFHPESILTPKGIDLIQNFIDIIEQRPPGSATEGNTSGVYENMA